MADTQQIKFANLASCADLCSKAGDKGFVGAANELLPVRSYERQAPTYLEMACLSSENRRYVDRNFSQTHCAGRQVRLIELHGAIVFGQGSVGLADGSLLLDSVAEFVNHGLAPDGSSREGDHWVLRQDSRVLPLKGRSLLVKRPWWRNFGHWLVDLMPILLLTRRSGVRVDNVIIGDVHSGGLHDLMMRSIEAVFPDCNCVEMQDDEIVTGDCLLYAEPVHVPPLYKHPDAIQASVELARSVYGRTADAVSQNRHPKRKVFVCRPKAAPRQITNEGDLIACVEGFGFEIVYPEQLGFGDQITLFEDADCVMGIKGAALTNAIFCTPGTDVLVLSPASFTDPFFWDLLTPRGVNYAEIFSRSQDFGLGASHQDQWVDVGAVDRYLSAQRSRR